MVLHQLVPGSGKGQNLYDNLYIICLEKTGRPNQAQVAPGIVFQEAPIDGRSHIRMV